MEEAVERTFFEWYAEPFKKYATFEGRSTRKEFWIFNFVNVAIVFALMMFELYDLYLIFLLGIVVPSYSLMARRLHDVGMSGWWQLIGGFAIFFILQDSVKGENKYGPNPKGIAKPETSPKIDPATSALEIDDGRNIIQKNPHASGSFFLTVLAGLMYWGELPPVAYILFAISGFYLYKSYKNDEDEQFGSAAGLLFLTGCALVAYLEFFHFGPIS